MDLQEFKDRLEAQGASWDLFIKRCLDYGRKDEAAILRMIDDGFSFQTVVDQGFYWASTPEGNNFWENVYDREFVRELVAKTESAEKFCDHDWVDVGFSKTRMVCKHCDREKP